MTEATLADATDQERGHRPWPPWVLCLPVALTLSYVIALKCMRAQPANAGTMLVLLAPLALVLSIPRRWGRDRGALVHSALVLAWVLWTALLIPLHPAHIATGMGWLGINCAGAVLFLAVAQSRCEDRTRGDDCLLASAVSCALALVVCAIDGPAVGFLDFGLGNINHTICAFDAPLWAGAVLIVGRQATRQRPRWVIIACVCAGIAALLWMCLTSPIGIRRGGLVAGMTALGFALASWGWSRSRGLTIAAGSLAALALIGFALHVRLPQEIASPVPSFRFGRVGLYKACLDRAAEVWPTGDGAYAVIRIPDSMGENARHWTAVGNWILGAHNDLLDALLDGGLPATLLWLAMAASITVRAWRIEDPAQRAACAALLAVLFVHAMTDNAYSVPLVRVIMGMPCALVFCCPARGAASTAPMPLPERESEADAARLGPRMLAWPMMGLAAWTGMWESSTAFVSLNASPLVHLAAVAQSEMPQPMIDEFGLAFIPMNDEVFEESERHRRTARGERNLEAMGYGLDTVTHRVGIVGRIAYARAAFSQQLLEADIDVHAPRARVDRDAEAAVAALLEVIRRYPFDVTPYRQLGDVMSKNEAGVHLVPLAVAVRANYLNGAPNLTAPSFQDPPRGIDEAADRFAALYWWLGSGHPIAEVAPAIRELVLDYGDCQSVSELGVRLILRSSGDGADLVRELEPGMRIGFLMYTVPEDQQLEIATSLQRDHPQPAAALVRHYFPEVWAGVVAGRYRVKRMEDPAIAVMCGQVYAALREAERPRR